MRYLLAILALAACIAPAQAQLLNERESQAERIGGRWLGRYYYSGQQANKPPVEFEMTIEVPVAGKVGGRISEPSTFGTAGVPFLYANVSGDISGNMLRFIKTYDGTGGQSHSVSYSGVFNETWTTLVGTWRLGDATGRFDLRR
ncbi:MAG: hypothetical protein KF889_17565 [Alphaproteobacteria bacterium]|nr:hypothetical protein [Alphaproteobacteria bacterium]MCW5739822.1 hypothetical protein [Alphaproteobacteria bacterium]